MCPTDTAKKEEDSAATTNGSAAVAAAPEEPPAKKKRGADRQITKGDRRGGDGDGGEAPKGPFAKASAEVLKTRKIVRVKRPAPNSSNSAAGASSSNPFASTSLTASKQSMTAPKVFGSSAGFGGFATAAASSGSSAGGGFGSSTGFGGFASTTASSATTGFGAAVASTISVEKTGDGKEGGAAPKTATWGSIFGTTGAAINTGSATNGTPSTSGFTFGFANKSKSNTGDSSADGEASSPKIAAAALPEHVELSTGEEDERNLHECRCKTFEWVILEDEDKEEGTTTGKEGVAPSVAAPSVQPSLSFQNATAATTKTDETEVESKESDAKLEESKEMDATTLPSPAKGAPTDIKPKSPQYRWKELGIGPMKLLQSASAPEKVRLVQRRESTPCGNATKVIFNVPVWAESKAELKEGQEKYLSFTTLDAKGKTSLYLWKFKETAQALLFAFQLQGVSPQAKSCFADDGNQLPENDDAKK